MQHTMQKDFALLQAALPPERIHHLLSPIRWLVRWFVLWSVAMIAPASLADQIFVFGPTPSSLQQKLDHSRFDWQQLDDQAQALPSSRKEQQGLKEKQGRKVLLVLGHKALAAAAPLSQQADITVIGYINPTQYRAHQSLIKTFKQARVYLRSSPLERQLKLLALLLPHHKRVGMLCSQQSCQTVEALKPYAQDLGIDLISQETKRYNLGSKLNILLDKSDSLLAMTDHSLYNSDTIGNILLNSYRRNKPLIGLSPAYVKAGVIATSYSTKEQYQAYLLTLLTRFLNTQDTQLAQETQQTLYYCPDFELSINHRVATSMDLILPLASAIKPLLVTPKSYEKR